MSAAAENRRAPGGGLAAALPYGALAPYRSHLVPHVRVLQAAVDDFADAGVDPRAATPYASPAKLAVNLMRDIREHVERAFDL
jgi:hypothetical protein